MRWRKDLVQRLESTQEIGRLRSLTIKDDLVDFASNDYLGIARSKRLKGAIINEMHNFDRMGSTGSRLLTGNSSYLERLEAKIASFHGYEAGLVFGSGYMANLGLLSAVLNPREHVYYDVDIHASARDGIRLSGAFAYPFRHNDLDHLEKRLQLKIPIGSHRYVCIASVYSTDGSIAPLQEVIDICSKYDARLVVDEAHAVGVWGPRGEGLVHGGLAKHLFAQVTTFGKALGSYGAIVMGSQVLKDYLVNFSRPFIYTTAPSFPVFAAIQCVYDILPELNEERQQLKNRIAQFTSYFEKKVFSHIQPIRMESLERTVGFSRLLSHKGLDARVLMPPTVKRGSELVRICLHTFNSSQEVELLVKCIEEYK